MKPYQTLLLLVILLGIIPKVDAQSPASHHFKYVDDRFGKTTDILFFEDSVLTDSFDVGTHNPYGFLPYPRSQRYDEWPSYKLDSIPFWNLSREWLPTFIEDSLELIQMYKKKNLDFDAGFSTFSCTNNEHYILILYNFHLYGETIHGISTTGLVLNNKGEVVHHILKNDRICWSSLVITDNGRFVAHNCGDVGPDSYLRDKEDGVEILDLETGKALIHLQKHPEFGYGITHIIQAENNILISYYVSQDTQLVQVIDPIQKVAYEKKFSHSVFVFARFKDDAAHIRRPTGEIIRVEPYKYFFKKEKLAFDVKED